MKNAHLCCYYFVGFIHIKDVVVIGYEDHVITMLWTAHQVHIAYISHSPCNSQNIHCLIMVRKMFVDCEM